MLTQDGAAIFTSTLNDDVQAVLKNFSLPKPKQVNALIKNSEGKVIFEKKDITAPEGWSQLAINIAA